MAGWLTQDEQGYHFVYDQAYAAQLGEFAGGSVPGAVNIPLDQVSSQIARFKDKKGVVVFCKSGMRSGQAKGILDQNGIPQVINGGTWQNVSKVVADQ